MTQEMFYQQLRRWPRLHFSQMQLQQENETYVLYALDTREPGGSRLFIARYDAPHAGERAYTLCQGWLDYLHKCEALPPYPNPASSSAKGLLNRSRLCR